MITPETQVFPFNVVDLMAIRLQAIDPDIKIYKRSLRESDGTQSIGIFPINWAPDVTTQEIGNQEPTIQRYPIAVQGLVLDTDEEQGIRVHGILAKRIRSMLYRDAALRLGLNVLSVTMDGATEKIQRRSMSIQRFLSNEVGGVFTYLSTLEYVVETETV